MNKSALLQKFTQLANRLSARVEQDKEDPTYETQITVITPELKKVLGLINGAELHDYYFEHPSVSKKLHIANLKAVPANDYASFYADKDKDKMLQPALTHEELLDWVNTNIKRLKAGKSTIAVEQ